MLGFVPEPGWFALQSPPPAIAGQQTVAVAANVPFAADDVVHGLVEPSGLPYSTLIHLPPAGIVIVTTMTPETNPHLAPIPTNPVYLEVDLPLRLRDGAPYGQWTAQVRPDQPLAQYQLRAKIRQYNVDVVAYFGTSRPVGGVARRGAAAAERARRALCTLDAAEYDGLQRPPPAAPLAVIDRTYACATTQLGGIYQLKTRAHQGIRSGSGWSKLPFFMASSGGSAEASYRPPIAPRATPWPGSVPERRRQGRRSTSRAQSFPVLEGGTLGVNSEKCQPVERSRSR